MTTETIDLGRRVLCDDCGEEYTDRPDEGGVLFGSKAICPGCAPTWLSNAAVYGEERFIRGRCPAGKSFADWVRDDVRGGRPGFIKVQTFEPGR